MIARRSSPPALRALAALVVAMVCLAPPVEAAAEEEQAPPTVAERVCAWAARLVQVAEYERAAGALEECASRAGTDGPLADAIVLRLGLGQRDAALRDLSNYLRAAAATHTAMASTLVLALALDHEAHEEWPRALDVLESRRDLLRVAPMEVRIRAHVAKGLALLATEKGTQGLAELVAARALHGDGAEVVREIAKNWPAESEGQHDRRLANVLRSVGQAELALADAERTSRMAGLGPPPYTGPRTAAAVKTFLTTKAPPWMQKRRAAIAAAEGAYLAVAAIRPLPPPGAVIDAASAVASMWADYFDDVARLVPRDGWPPGADAKAGRPPAEVLLGVTELRDSIAASFVAPAMKRCVHLSVAYQLTDARSRACEAWLTTNDPDHFHAASELAPAVRAPARAWVNADALRAPPPSP